MAQSVFRHVALPLMLCGVVLAFGRDRAPAGLILGSILYYWIVGSALHTEIRYGLPMQALLLIFAAFPVCYLMDLVQSPKSKVQGQKKDFGL
jgi:ABC-type uncharacterized transport system permease subunit